MLPAGETIVRIRATGGRDPYGDPTGTDERTDIPGCGIAPEQTGETIGGGRLAVTSGLTVYAPPGTDVLPSDRFEVRGVVYQVAGEAAGWTSPYTGARRGTTIPLTRVQEGSA